ncbi:hypothetical protein ACJJTC_005452 [Scirpophaga incertulas]
METIAPQQRAWCSANLQHPSHSDKMISIDIDKEKQYKTVSESARVKISATRVDSKNERGEWRLWRAPRAVRSGWRPEARPGRVARPPSPRVTSSERLRVSPNLPDDRNFEPREKEIILVVGFLSDG